MTSTTSAGLAPGRDVSVCTDGQLGPKHSGKILVLTDRPDQRRQISVFLASRGHAVVMAVSETVALDELRAGGVDLVISAMAGSELGGVEIVRKLRLHFPDLPVVVLALGSAELDHAHLDCAANLGRAIANGARVRSNLLGSLTDRERQVFDLIVAGNANKIIAYKLTISPRTVENHRARLMEKLGTKSVADLVRLALGAEQITSHANRNFVATNDTGDRRPAPVSA